VISTLVC
jgi:hypothetical protein